MSRTPAGLDGNADAKQMGFASTSAVMDENTGKAVAPAAASKGLDAPDVKGTVDLISKEGTKFTVNRKDAFISTLVRTALENDDKATEVPVPATSTPILEMIVQYMKEHKGEEPPIIEKPLRSRIMKDVCPYKWDADFIDRAGEPRQQLYDLILAANYMDIKSLLHLGCAKVASMIKGQPLEQIKAILDPKTAAKK